MGISNTIPPSRLIQPGVCTSSTKPTSPFEGQMVYTTDLDTLEIWNGTAWRIIGLSTPTNGAVLQVVTSSNETETSSSSASWVTTGLNASITPKSTSNKILAIWNVAVSISSATNNGYISLFRGTVAGTNLGNTSIGSGFGGIYNSGGRIDTVAAGNHLDSPSTISSQTYTIGMFASTGITMQAQKFSAKSTLTLMEIAG